RPRTGETGTVAPPPSRPSADPRSRGTVHASPAPRTDRAGPPARARRGPGAGRPARRDMVVVPAARPAGGSRGPQPDRRVRAGEAPREGAGGRPRSRPPHPRPPAVLRPDRP